MLCCLPGFAALFFFSNYKKVVQGANDNLTGSLAAVSILKYLKEADISYDDIEVTALITGSEEAGLRGAKAFAQKHLEECKQIPTMFIGFETLRDIEHITNYEKDLSGLVRHSDQAIELIDKAAIKVYGKPLKHGSIFLGASDAAAITQAGITAGTLAAMDPAPAYYYHTRKDSADNLNPECFGEGLKLALNILDIYAKED
jgi:Zn-dependent M28 family amino/carboxypeptidase